MSSTRPGNAGDHSLVSRTITRLEDWCGRRGLRIVAGAPVASSLLVGALLPILTHADVEATALIDMYPVVGTHATYDVIGHVVDFSTSFMTGGAVRAAADSAGLGPTSLTALLLARREDDSTRVRISLAAPSERTAEDGLRSAARVALRQTVEGIRDRRRADYDEMRKSFEALLTDVNAWKPQTGPAAAPAAAVEVRRISAVQKAGQRMEDVRGELTAAELSLGAIDGIVDSTVVTTSRLSSARDEFRVIAASALSTWAVALAAVLVIRTEFGSRRLARLLG